MTMKKSRRTVFLAIWTLVLLLCTAGCAQTKDLAALTADQASYTLSDVPEYSGEPYVTLNENQPDFSEEDLTETSFEAYSEQDALGRCLSLIHI